MLAGPNSAPLSTPDTRTAGTKESEMLAIGSCQTIPGVLALKMYVHTIRSLQLRRCSHFQVSGEHIRNARPSWRVGDVGNLLPNEKLLQFTESPDMLMIDRWWDFLS